MKSKISFFNKTIFLKNITLYWPIWGVYTIALLFAQSCMLWISYNDAFYYGNLSDERKLYYLRDILTMEMYIWIIFIMAVVTGMALFSYLYNSRSANMIHSLPVDRNQLFGTNVISGLTFLAIPQIFTFLVSVFVCLGAGMTRVEYLAYWVLLCLGIDFIAFGIVTFCAFFTGQLVTLPIYVIILNGLSYLFYGIIELVVSAFSYGITGSVINMEWVIWASPFMRLYNDINFYSVFNQYEEKIEALGISGIPSVLIYVVIDAILYIAAYLIYKKRQVEQAGDLITVEWVKPIFRWGVGTSAAFLGSILFYALFGEMGRPISLPVFMILLLVIGMVFYFVADMFVKKSFKVFNKRGWKHWSVFSVVLLITFGALYGYSCYSENYVPDRENVASAKIDYSYNCTFTEEDIEKVITLQEMILEHKDEFGDWTYFNGDYDYINISYIMKNGRTIHRCYKVPWEGNGADIYALIHKMELEPDVFLKSYICDAYEKVENFAGASIGYIENENYDWLYLDISKENCEKLYKAIIADANAGILQQYNMRYSYAEMYKGIYEVNDEVIVEKIDENQAELHMDYYIPEELSKEIIKRYLENGNTLDNTTWLYDIETDMECSYQKAGNKLQSSFAVQFGKDCTNIINALIEMNYIESAEDLFWQNTELESKIVE